MARRKEACRCCQSSASGREGMTLVSLLDLRPVSRLGKPARKAEVLLTEVVRKRGGSEPSWSPPRAEIVPHIVPQNLARFNCRFVLPQVLNNQETNRHRRKPSEFPRFRTMG